MPNFSTLYPLEGDVGPFRVGQPLQVPLWMALNLRQRQKCRIVQPEWMTPERLKAARDKIQLRKIWFEKPIEFWSAISCT